MFKIIVLNPALSYSNHMGIRAGLLLRQREALRCDLAVLGDLLSACPPCPPALLPPGCLATAFSYHHPGRALAWYLEENPVTSLVA